MFKKVLGGKFFFLGGGAVITVENFEIQIGVLKFLLKSPTLKNNSILVSVTLLGVLLV